MLACFFLPAVFTMTLTLEYLAADIKCRLMVSREDSFDVAISDKANLLLVSAGRTVTVSQLRSDSSEVAVQPVQTFTFDEYSAEVYQAYVFGSRNDQYAAVYHIAHERPAIPESQRIQYLLAIGHELLNISLTVVHLYSTATGNLQKVQFKPPEGARFGGSIPIFNGCGQVDYLGHIVGADGVRMDDSKIKAITARPTPTTKKQLRSFLGLAGYYRRFIERFAHRVTPLSKLLKENAAWIWEAAQDNAFNDIKVAMTTAPVLAIPDDSLPYEVYTDASGVGVGAILTSGSGQRPAAVCLPQPQADGCRTEVRNA